MASYSPRLRMKRLEYDTFCMHIDEDTGEKCGKQIPAGDLLYYYGAHSIFGINCHDSSKRNGVRQIEQPTRPAHQISSANISINIKGNGIPFTPEQRDNFDAMMEALRARAKEYQSGIRIENNTNVIEGSAHEILQLPAPKSESLLSNVVSRIIGFLASPKS